jgi:hypothetical protein
MIIAALHGTVGNLDEILVASAGLVVLLLVTFTFSRGKTKQDPDGTE